MPKISTALLKIKNWKWKTDMLIVDITLPQKHVNYVQSSIQLSFLIRFSLERLEIGLKRLKNSYIPNKTV